MSTEPDTAVTVFDVPDSFRLPELTDLLSGGKTSGGKAGDGDGAGDGKIGEVEVEVEVRQHQLTDAYLDTAAADLAASGAALCRRSGTLGVSWVLRLPVGSKPPELTSRSTAQVPPRALAAAALGLTRGQDLAPLAELTTQRTVTTALDADGQLRLEVVEERTSSTTSGDVSRLDHWRTVTVRAGTGTDVGPVLERLRKAGASPAGALTPLERALGRPIPPPRGAASTLADLVGDYVAEQCDQIARGDLALRLGEPQVHRTRVAIRRLRSTLRVFAELLDPGPTARLEEELVWWAGLLGEVRDREVLAARLAEQVAALPPELGLGPVAADLDATLSRERAGHVRAVEGELAGDRLLALLEALARWRTEPPFLEAASGPAADVRSFVQTAGRTARRRLRRAVREEAVREQVGREQPMDAEAAQDEQLHRARKAAKRARYAAELAEPAWPRAARHVAAAKDLQTLLGEHQDSVVSAAFLLRAGAATAGRRGRNGFTYGLLYAEELQRAAEVRRQVQGLDF